MHILRQSEHIFDFSRNEKVPSAAASPSSAASHASSPDRSDAAGASTNAQIGSSHPNNGPQPHSQAAHDREELEQAKARETALRAEIERLKADAREVRLAADRQHTESEKAGVLLEEKIRKACEEIDTLKAEVRTVRAEADEAGTYRQTENEQGKVREAALCAEIDRLKTEVREVRDEADQANARRRAESERSSAREAVLSKKLSEVQECDAKAAVEIARLQVEKAVLKREMCQRSSAGDAVGAPGGASEKVKRELEYGLGWDFRWS